jgi:transcriptional regulator with XRE-family HTH domain
MADNSQGKTNQRHPALAALGQQIRKVRQERGISQEDFAAAAGLDRSYYGGIERGDRNIAALNLMRIAVALNVGVGELFPDPQALAQLLASQESGNPD